MQRLFFGVVVDLLKGDRTPAQMSNHAGSARNFIALSDIIVKNSIPLVDYI